MGVVYRAHDVRHNRTVAIKRLTENQPLDPVSVARFENEIRALASVEHPHIVRLYDSGLQGDRPYVVMEYIDGPSVTKQMNGRPLPPLDTAVLIEKVARAVQVVNSKGLLHRDLKPANILLTGEGEPKVSDFGLARLVGETDARLTRPGTTLGTPEYMSPEQARGESATPAFDVYSLGASLYELLTGRPPFQGASDSETLMLVQIHDLISVRRLVPGTPKDLETICKKCLELDPARRYPTAGSLADDLRAFLEGRPITARPRGLTRRSSDFVRRNRFGVALSAALVLTFFTVSIAAWKIWREPQRDALTARLAAFRQVGMLTDAECAQTESWIKDLESLDRDVADNEQEKYIDMLIEIVGRPGGPGLERLERAVDYFAVRGEAERNQLRTPARWNSFKTRLAPNSHSTNLDFFIRPNPKRVENLERLVRIAATLTSNPEKDGSGVRPKLIRAHLTAVDLPAAKELAETLLDQPSVPAAWRLLVFRDLVWVALSSGKGEWCDDVEKRVRDQLLADNASDQRGQYAELQI
jgi:serine/threonine-protein kinase